MFWTKEAPICLVVFPSKFVCTKKHSTVYNKNFQGLGMISDEVKGQKERREREREVVREREHTEIDRLTQREKEREREGERERQREKERETNIQKETHT